MLLFDFVHPVQVVVLEPLIATIDVGENITFTCSLDEDGNFTWFYTAVNSSMETAVLPSNVAIKSSSMESVLTVTVATEDNSGLYRCRGAGLTQTGSDCAQLYVNGWLLMQKL